jgi:twitching motility protein PilT
MAEVGASDLHLQVGSRPTLRIHGVLRGIESPALTGEDVSGFLKDMTSEEQRARYRREQGLDFSYAVADTARFRVGAFLEKNQPALAVRMIPPKVPTLEQLNLPFVLREIAQIERGLVLVTGTTGSGKSSTLAAMIDYINHNQKKRIITVEDPIEYVHVSDQSLIAQRELGVDAGSFLGSLRQALREDPDAILLGEMRDPETVLTALQAADTGHAVFSTLHTTNATQTIQRLITMFPPDTRELLLHDLAGNLEAVISQRLARTADGKGRVPVLEILRGTSMSRKLIIEGRANSLSQIIAGRENGQQLFDQHLVDLYKAGTIGGTESMRLATNPEAVLMAKRGIMGQGLKGGLVR